MLERNVSINGQVLYIHEIAGVTIIPNDHVTITVESWSQDRAIGPVDSFHELPFSDGLYVSDWERLLWLSPAFAEWVPEVPEEVDMLLDILTDEQALIVPGLYPEWAGGISYAVGKRVRHNNVLYKCLATHTSQTDWSPDISPSIWARLLIPDPDVIPDWEQPDSTNAYMTGDKVHHNNKTWESTVDNNVWEPGVYGWDEVS